MTWIQTLSGLPFDLVLPSSKHINRYDLAMALSRMCRFGGHCVEFYSVAQHSVLVCDLVADRRLKLPALLHDAHEAYWGLGDIAAPAKAIMPKEVRDWLTAHERRVDAVIGEAFGCPASLMRCAEVKHADMVALATERRDVMAPCVREWPEMPPPHADRIDPMPRPLAYRLFLRRLSELLGED